MKKNRFKKMPVLAATSILVVSTTAPVVGLADTEFDDVPLWNEFAPYIYKLNEQGIIKGYTATNTFRPNDKLTRGQVVIMLGRWLEAQGEKIPTDWDTVQRFNDLPVYAQNEELVKYAALAKDAGVFNGTLGQLLPGQHISREQMAAVLNRVTEVIGGISLIGLAEEIEDIPVVDLDAAIDNYKPAIQALRDLSISTTATGTFNPKGDVTRAHFSKFLYLTIKTIDELLGNETPEEEQEESKELTLDSVVAAGAKKIQITFNQPVDTTKAIFAVTKDNVAQNMVGVTWNEQKTIATLELVNKFVTGQYQVTVSGLTDAVLTSTITTEAEKVASIDILSNQAVLTADGTAATLKYKVYNQYGEDLTNITSLTANVSGLAVHATPNVFASQGTISFKVAENARIGDLAVATLIHTGSGVATSKSVTLADKATVSEIAIKGLYNKDGKTLTETTNLAVDAFYLLVEGKDQYGNEVNSQQLQDLLVTNSNNTVVGLNSVFETITIDNKQVTALKLYGTPKAGETLVMFVSKFNGKNATYTLKVEESQRANTVTFNAPSFVVAGETTFIPMTVLDKDGNAITDLDLIRNPQRGVTISGVTNTIKKNSAGVIGVEIPGNQLTQGFVTLIAITATSQSNVVNLDVKEQAKPTMIRGVKDTVPKVLTENYVLTANDLAVIDQYGRTMGIETTSLTLAASATATSGYRVAVTDNAVSTAIANGGITQYIYASSGATLVKGVNGTESVTLQLEQNINGVWTPVANSTATTLFEVTDGTQYVSYQVDEIGILFDEVGAGKVNSPLYNKNLVVYGVLSSGNKVKLNTSAYSVNAPAYLNYVSGAFNLDGTVSVPYTSESSNLLVADVVITINSTGQQFTKSVTVSKVAPTVSQLKVVATGTNASTMDQFNAAQEVTKLNVTSNATIVNELVDFLVVDSYNVVHTIGSAPSVYLDEIRLVATPAVENTITFNAQNTYNLILSDLQAAEQATISATINGLSKQFTLVGTR
ncbi:S-layer homology domain-containing protein [Lysinibacillus sp. LZ02]|uniref:S-layer homology domain-containing protein n=1 Tax=Lysinibacillus sp. LZ02 TaxID=3420668 RepID=UPI003D361625